MNPTPDRDRPSWAILLGMVALSVLGHVGTLITLPSTRPLTLALNKPVEMEIITLPPPKVEEPEPPEPEPPKPIAKPPPVKVAVVKPPPDAPPPPNDEPPPEPTKPVPLVIGVSLSSTTSAGGFAAPVGNTLYGKTADKAVAPTEVKAYAAPKYVPPGGADTDPVLMGEVKIDYPPRAKAAEIEGTVRLKVTVDFEGKVTDVVVISGPGYGLEEAAREALKRFRFKPATKGGEAVGTTLMYAYTFLMD